MAEKKYSIGLNSLLSHQQWVQLLKNYGQYIDKIYFSPPLGYRFSYKPRLYKSNYFSNINNCTDYIKFVLKSIKSINNSIKIEFALNTKFLLNGDISTAYEWLNKSQIDIDSILTMTEYIPEIRQIKQWENISLTHSANELIRDKSLNTDKFDEIIIAFGANKNPELWEYYHNLGKRTRLIINTGCMFDCNGLCFSQCNRTLDENLKNESMVELFSKYTIMPHEFYKYWYQNNNLDSFGFSIRDIEPIEVTDTFDSYIKDIETECIKGNTLYYKIWNSNKIFLQEYNRFNYQKITQFKNALNTKIFK
jgi:hypothetical protein